MLLAQIDRLLAKSDELLKQESAGLVPVNIPMDDALLTALTLRLDLQNQREGLADNWRRIKFTADELKSVLNLHASQRLTSTRTIESGNDFTFDQSETRIGLTFDAPLNRRAQRNEFRNSLMQYNAGLRSLIGLEDTIKADVRQDLRELMLGREQYQIAVASTALAYERRFSTRLQLRLGLENIRVQDVLDAQGAYTGALSDLAGAHINYVLDRVRLFLDLELLQVDHEGFWPQLYDEKYQPTASYQLPNYGLPIYGQLPSRTLPSHLIRRMLEVPPGETIICRPDTPAGNAPEEVPAPNAEPLRGTGRRCD